MSIKKEKILILGSANPIATAIIRFINCNFNNQYDVVGMDYINESNKHYLHNVYMNKNSTFYPTDQQYSNMESVMIMESPHYIVDCSYIVINNIQNYFRKVKKFIQLSQFPKHIFSGYNNFYLLEHSQLFGPRINDNIIYNFFKQIKSGNVELINKGLNTNNILYVDDVASAIVYMLNLNSLDNETFVYTASSNNDYIDLEICTIIADSLDLIPKYIMQQSTINTITTQLAASTKLKDIGWSNSKIKDKIKYTSNWFKMNSWFINQ